MTESLPPEQREPKLTNIRNVLTVFNHRRFKIIRAVVKRVLPIELGRHCVARWWWAKGFTFGIFKVNAGWKFTSWLWWTLNILLRKDNPRNLNKKKVVLYSIGYTDALSFNLQFKKLRIFSKIFKAITLEQFHQFWGHKLHIFRK